MRKKLLRWIGVVAIAALALILNGLAVPAYAQSTPIVDGLLDDSYHFDKRLNLPEGGNFAPGTLYHYESSDACYWAYVVDRNYNDNVYSSVDNNYLALDGWTNGHDFRELIHSDMAEFVIQYPGGTTRTFELDYMNWKQTDYGGQPGNLSKLVDPPVVQSGILQTSPDTYDDTPSYSQGLISAVSSLEYNVLHSGWYEQTGSTAAFVKQSPPYDYNDTPGQYWEWQMIYEFSTEKVNNSCGEVADNQGGAHNSPAKDVGSSTLYRVGNYVWLDSDGDGIQNNDYQDDPASGIANVTVRLRSASTHEIVRVTQTAPDGYYIFSNVPAGSYYVEFVLPYGYGFTKANQGGNDELDSDADPATGKTASFTLNADKLDLDAGLVELPQGDLCVEDMESTVDALGHYSLIVLDDITGSGHSEGRVFVGGNWLMGGTQPLGHNIPDPVPCSDMALTVVGNIGNNSQIQVLNGGATYGGSILGGSAIQMNSGCSVVHDPTLSSEPLRTQLENASLTMASATANNTPTVNGNNVTFQVNNKNADGLAVFNVNASDIFKDNVAVDLINTADATTILINVAGTSIKFPGSLNFVGRLGNPDLDLYERIIWNFYEAESINLQAQRFSGTLFAPLATVQGTNNIDGSAVVKALTNIGESHVFLFAQSNKTPLTNLCEPPAPEGAIEITKRQDTPGSGPTLAGWSFTITNTTTNVSYGPKATDGSGKATFNDLPYGTYEVCETLQPGWLNVTPLCQTVVVDSPESTPAQVEFVNFELDADITIKKYTNGHDADLAADAPQVEPGSTVTWTYVVKNTGNVTLTNVMVTDDKEGLICEIESLAPKASDTCEKTGVAGYGLYANEATVVGTPSEGPSTPVTDDDPSHYYGIIAPAITIKKYTNGHDADTLADAPEVEPGSTVTWTYEVKNTGNVTLTNVTVTDDKEDLICIISSLAPKASDTCEKTGIAGYGEYANLGSVVGTPEVGPSDPVTDDDPSHYYGRIAPAITIKKYTNGHDADNAPGPYIAVDDAVTWTYEVKNTGNVTLTNITVTDDQGVQVSCPASELDPDASMTCTGNGTAQLGQYANIGTVIGTSVLDESVQVTDSDPSHYFGVKAAITIKKYTNGVDADLPVDAPEVEPGSTVNWTYVVQNTGNITLTNVTVTDNEEGPICEIQSLAPEASDTCEKTGIAGHGLYANIATVVGTPAAAGLPNVTDDDPSHYYGRITPSIALKKYTNGHDADEAPGPIVEPGSTVTWTYVVQNTGNIALTNVIVTDDVEGDICIIPSLAAKASDTCEKTGIAGYGQYKNNGHVVGTPDIQDAQPVTDTDPSHYFGAINPAIDIEKTTNGEDADTPESAPQVAPGSTVVWHYLVTNTGNVPLVNVEVTDDKEGPVTCPTNTLAPGESMTCTLEGVAGHGLYANNGIVVGTPQTGGEPVIDTDPSHYFGTIMPSIDIEKATNGHDADEAPGPVIEAGSPVVWTYVVRNTGNIALENVTVSDDVEGPVTCPQTTLAPGESMTCTLEGTAIEGQYANIGSVIGTPTEGEVEQVSDSDPSHYVGAPVDEPVLPASVGNLVWFDDNEDGIQDSGEQGVEGVVVRLFRDNFDGSAINTATTDENGEYLFTDLEAGTYCLEFEIPADFEVSPAHVGDDAERDSDGVTIVNATTVRTDCFTLDAGQVDLTRDLGVYEATPPTGENPIQQPGDAVQRLYLPALHSN